MAVLHGRLALARQGHGQVVGIVGEPGIGKSRLIQEFQQALREEAVTYLEARCVSYGAGVPFLPIVEMLGQACGLADSDSPETVAVKVSESLQRLGLDAGEATPYVLQLLGVKEGTMSLAELTPEAINARSLDVLRKMALLSSQQRPLILTIEDVHWIDRSSSTYVEALAESLPGAPILLLLTFRPGHQPSVMTRSYATQIALSPLSAPDSLTIAQSIIGAEGFADVVARTILEKAEGNPFFIEELARAMAAPGVGDSAVPVPDSVEAVLSARIDRLSDDARRLLQAASVIGRRVALRLLAALWEGPEDLDAHLRELIRLEFLYAQTVGEEPHCVFKHALTQEVAYASLPLGDRQALHAAVARALERLHAERLNEVYDRLAYHYSRTTETDKAVDYLVRFADKAAAVHAHAEAVTALEQALIHVDRLAAAEGRRLSLEVALRLAYSLYFLGRIRERLELLLRYRDAVEASGDPALTGRYYLLLGTTYSLLGDRARAGESGGRALDDATRAGDEATMGKAHYVLAHEEYWAGRLARSVEHGRAAVGLLEGKGEPWWLGMAHWILSVAYGSLGDFEAAIAIGTRARALGEAIGDLRLQSYADWTIGGAYAVTGRHVEGIEACRRGLRLSADPVGQANALGFLGGALVESGNADEAIPLLEQSVRLFNQFRIVELEGWFSALLAEAHLLRGDLATALNIARHGLALSTASGYWVGIGYSQRALGRVAQAQGDLSGAERHLTEACETFRSRGAQHWVGRTLLALAEVAHAQRRDDAIGAYLAEAYDIFRALKVPVYLEETERQAAEMRIGKCTGQHTGRATSTDSA